NSPAQCLRVSHANESIRRPFGYWSRRHRDRHRPSGGSHPWLSGNWARPPAIVNPRLSLSLPLPVSPSSSGGLRFDLRRVSSIGTCRFQVTRAIMGYFYSLVAESPILVVLHLALVVWMLVDAHRRGVDYYWYYIILFIPVAGPVAYLFIFKA